MATLEDFRIIQNNAYVRFDYTGEFSQAAGKQGIDAMVEACRRPQISRALLDCSKMTGEIEIFVAKPI